MTMMNEYTLRCPKCKNIVGIRTINAGVGDGHVYYILCDHCGTGDEIAFLTKKRALDRWEKIVKEHEQMKDFDPLKFINFNVEKE